MVLGAAPNPKDTGLKKEGEKINPSKPWSRSEGDVKRHSSLHLQEHSATGTGGPVTVQKPLLHIEGTLIWGEDSAPKLLLLQNSNKPKKIPSMAEGLRD